MTSGPSSFAFIGTADDPAAAVAEYEKAYQKRSAQRAKARLPAEPFRPPSVPVNENLWLRRPVSTEPLSGTLYTPASPGQPGHEVPFAAPLKASLADSNGLTRAWAVAAASHLNGRPGAFFRFASARIRQRYLGLTAEALYPLGATRSGSELSRLMDTTTGRISIQEALEAERPLYLAKVPKRASISIDRVKPPELARHPTALRQKLSESAPDMAVWSEAPGYRSTVVVRVSMHGFGESAELYYALMPAALVLSLNESALHEAIDQLLDRPPMPVTDPAPAARAGQVVLDLAGDKGSALYGVLGWLVSQTALEAADHSRSMAEAIFRGAPEIANDPAASASLMRAYFGAVARTPDGRAYLPGPDAPRDPLRGTPYAPIWPEVPAPGSPAERVLSQLGSLRSEVAFDDEPAVPGSERLQSLRTRVVVKLRR